MHTFYAVIIQIAFFILLTLTIFGCQPKKEVSQIDCQDKCLIYTVPDYTVRFNSTKIMVEKPITLTITANKVISRVYLRGVNMNMGVLNLPFTLLNDKTQSDNKLPYIYAADFTLGICSEAEMQWSLIIEPEQGIETELRFTSYWQ